jgi:hypothetical protein
MSRKPDPALTAALRPLLEQAKRELKADLGKALEQGAATWAQQSNQIFEAHAVRLARLEHRAKQR